MPWANGSAGLPYAGKFAVQAPRQSKALRHSGSLPSHSPITAPLYVSSREIFRNSAGSTWSASDNLPITFKLTWNEPFSIWLR